MAGLSWLHVSDWHQAGLDFDREVVRDALITDVRKRASRISSELGRIDFIVLSGDLAKYGKPDEYQAARRHFLDPLLDAAGIAPDRLFLVPGNHDLNWESFELLPCAVTKPLKSAADVEHWLNDARRFERLVEPFAAYENFAETYCKTNRSVQGYVSRFRASDKEIAILGLNSAIMTGRVRRKGEACDRDNIVLGEPQVHRTLGEASGAEIIVAVLHHPFDWLAEFDRNRNQQALGTACHFILCGHQHRPAAQASIGTDGSYVCIPAGACYSRPAAGDSDYWHSYNFVHLDLDRGAGNVFFRRWSARKSEWLQDQDAADRGRLSFKLPKDLGRRPKPPRQPRSTPRQPPRAASADKAKILKIHGCEYVFIPGGEFVMGSSKERVDQLVRETNQRQFCLELPAHPVRLKPFYIARFPVTNREYAEFIKETGRPLRSHDDSLSRSLRWDQDKRCFPEGLADHPVVLVSWFDAREYCRWRGGRLPTEAEWEKAARGPEGFEWPWGNEWQDQRCNSWESRRPGTTPVGCFSPVGDSPYGVADMAGNSAEWCSSLQIPYPYRGDDGRESEEAHGRRVIRGGAFTLDRKAARCAFRDSADPGSYGPTIGFRVVFDRLPR